jgi:hypothetical protein
MGVISYPRPNHLRSAWLLGEIRVLIPALPGLVSPRWGTGAPGSRLAGIDASHGSARAPKKGFHRGGTATKHPRQRTCMEGRGHGRDWHGHRHGVDDGGHCGPIGRLGRLRPIPRRAGGRDQPRRPRGGPRSPGREPQRCLPRRGEPAVRRGAQHARCRPRQLAATVRHQRRHRARRGRPVRCGSHQR